MAGKAKTSRKFLSASASVHSRSEEMASPVKSKDRMRRSARQRRVREDEEEEERPKTIAKRRKGNQKKKNIKFDAKKPKKPPTAFFYFLDDFRKEFQEQNPDVKSMRDVGKACGEKWKTMTYEEKVQYYDVATEKRAEFDRVMAEYIKRKESGEDQESDEDTESEFSE